MKKFFNSLVVWCSSIGTTNCVHCAISNNWVFRTTHFLNKRLSLLFFAVHLECKTHWKGSYDLFVLLVLDMIQEILDWFLVSSSYHDETHSVASSFTNNSWVGIAVEQLLKFFINLGVVGCNCNESETQADTMLNGLILAAISHSVFQVVHRFLWILVLVYQTIGEVGSSCWIRWILLTWDTCTREVRIQDCKCILAISSMDQT